MEKEIKSVEDITKELDEKYKEMMDEEFSGEKEPGPLIDRAKEDYGVDFSEVRESAWKKIREYSSKFEKTLIDSVLTSDEPIEVLNIGERVYHRLLGYFKSDSSEKYLTQKVNEKVNGLLQNKVLLIKNEKGQLEDLLTETNDYIISLRTEKSEILRNAGRGDRDRVEGFRKYQDIEKELVDLLDDLETAENIHTVDNDMSQYIIVIENSIERNEKGMELYGDIVSQAQGVQEASNERYDMILDKLNEQRFIKNELRKYLDTLKKIERKMELHIMNGSSQEYNKPLERVGKVREIIQDSANTINKLVEASYISKKILTGFPEYEAPETKHFSKQNRFDFDERLHHDIANRKGADIAQAIREKRKAEIRSTYDLH